MSKQEEINKLWQISYDEQSRRCCDQQKNEDQFSRLNERLNLLDERVGRQNNLVRTLFSIHCDEEGENTLVLFADPMTLEDAVRYTGSDVTVERSKHGLRHKIIIHPTSQEDR